MTNIRKLRPSVSNKGLAKYAYRIPHMVECCVISQIQARSKAKLTKVLRLNINVICATQKI